MKTHIEFKDKEGCWHTHPIKDLLIDGLVEFGEDDDIFTYKINNYEVYPAEYNRVTYELKSQIIELEA